MTTLLTLMPTLSDILHYLQTHKRRVIVIVIALLILKLLWPSGAPQESGPDEDQLILTVSRSTAHEIHREIVLYGVTQPNRAVELISNVSNNQGGSFIVSINKDKGDFYTKGEVIVTLESRDLPSLLEEAKALAHQKRIEFEAAQKLYDKQLQSEAGLAAKRTELEEALSELANREAQLKDLSIYAPFDGILATRSIQLGQRISSGDAIGLFAQIDPLEIGVDVTERERPFVYKGMPCRAVTQNGVSLEGEVSFVAPVGDPNTRTFSVEITVPNPSGSMPTGQTVDVTLVGDSLYAHKIAQSNLSLNDEGQLGIKYIDANGAVAFTSAQAVRFENDAVWLSGLPKTLDMITYGQGFAVLGKHYPLNYETDDSSEVAADTSTPQPNIEDV